MATRYVLDSFALLALLRDEPGAPLVSDLIEQADAGEAELLMSEINLGEVIYHVERRHDTNEAQKTLVEIEVLPIEMVTADRGRILEAAHLKATHRFSYADAFAAALAMEYQATLVTGDPEFRPLEGSVAIAWLARK